MGSDLATTADPPSGRSKHPMNDGYHLMTSTLSKATFNQGE